MRDTVMAGLWHLHNLINELLSVEVAPQYVCVPEEPGSLTEEVVQNISHPAGLFWREQTDLCNTDGYR